MIDNGTICWPVIQDAETGIFLTLRLDAKVLDGGCEFNRLDPPLAPITLLLDPVRCAAAGMGGVEGRDEGRCLGEGEEELEEGGERHCLIVRDCMRDIWLWG